mgnify:FL=1
MSINFSLTLPCFNEEQNILHLYNEFKKLPLAGIKAELIFVDNGSVDLTGEKIDEVIKINKADNTNFIIKKITLESNQGYGGGIVAGLLGSSGDYIGWTHADLQTPLIDFYNLYNLINNKKLVFGKGYRVNNRGFDGLISRLHERCASLILGFNMREINAQPKIFHKSVLKYFTNMPKKWTTLDTYANYICLLNNIEIVKIDIIFKNRLYGESKWKNNFSVFVKTIFFNLLYLIKLRLSKGRW